MPIYHQQSSSARKRANSNNSRVGRDPEPKPLLNTVPAIREDQGGSDDDNSPQNSLFSDTEKKAVFAAIGAQLFMLVVLSFHIFFEARAAEDSLSEKPVVNLTPPGRSTISARPSAQVLSWEPRIFLFEDVLTPEQCDALILKTAGRLKGVGTFSDKEADEHMRTSQSMWFSDPSDADDEVVSQIRSTLLDLVLAPTTHAEDLQITRYTPGDKYELHYDFSQPDRNLHAPQKFPHGDVERSITVLAYLTDDFEGGETVFPRVREPGTTGQGLLQKVPDVGALTWERVGKLDAFCDEEQSDALRVSPPRRGSVIVFFGYKPDGRSRDMDTIHGSCPVKSGVKIVAQQWVQMNRMYAGKHVLEALTFRAPQPFHKPDAEPMEETVAAAVQEKNVDAIATLVSTPEYALGAVVLGRTLVATGSSKGRDLVALVPPHENEKLVTSKQVQWLKGAGWKVRRVSCLQHVVGDRRSFMRPDLANVSFSKIHLWNMTQYERVLFIDADALVTKNIGFLFDSLGSRPMNGVVETNGQVKTGLFGIRPSIQTFQRLVHGLGEADLVEFTNNEQGYVSAMLADAWDDVPSSQRFPIREHLCSGHVRCAGASGPACGMRRCGTLRWSTFRGSRNPGAGRRRWWTIQSAGSCGRLPSCGSCWP